MCKLRRVCGNGGCDGKVQWPSKMTGCVYENEHRIPQTEDIWIASTPDTVKEAMWLREENNKKWWEGIVKNLDDVLVFHTVDEVNKVLEEKESEYRVIKI
jgi:hypothetical protein